MMGKLSSKFEFSSDFMNKKSQTKSVPTQCVICGGSALYSFYGAIVCQTCKIFFRRNAEQEKEKLKCHFDGYCEVNLNTRHVCSYCRLQKCFANGMQTEMIRASRPKTNKTSEKRKNMTDSVERGSTIVVKLKQPEHLATLNLLRSDQSTLTVDQWNLISNLADCFDEHNGLSIGEQFMREQNNLPLKMRYKSTAVIGLIKMLSVTSQSLYQNNRDFHSLSSGDRSVLLDHSFTNIGALATNFLMYHVRLMDQPAYHEAVGVMSHPSVIPTAERIKNRLDVDRTVMKLFLAILSFSTMSLTIYTNIPAVSFSNIKEILRIQDSYIELTWRYLLYRYDYTQAVRCLSDLIRAVFATHHGLTRLIDIQWYINTMDCLIEQIKQTDILDE